MKRYLKGKTKFLLLMPVIAVFLTLLIFLATPRVLAVAKEKYERIGIFVKVLDYVENNYVKEVDVKDLIYGAIKGMLNSLNDPHTTFLSPELFKEMKIDTTGKFGGIGIEITVKDGVLIIIAPIEGTPAFKGGLKAGDRILKIDNEFTKGLTLMEAVNKMRGRKGTSVTLMIMREGFTEPKDFKIERDIIKIQSIRSSLLEPGYGYVKIVSFQEGTYDDLRKMLEKLEKDNQNLVAAEMKKQKKEFKPEDKELKGIVLDLRNNPGGLLDQAVKVADAFLEKGIIVSTVGRNKENKEIEYARKAGTWKNIPMVIIVDGASASASEIVAGALQDHKRAIVIGSRSFGKGSVQTVIELADKSGLKLTVAQYFTPSGRSIQEMGIEPDISIPQFDPALIEKESKKKRFVREEDIKHPEDFEKKMREEQEEEKKENSNSNNEEENSAKDPLKHDYQLQQGLNFLKSWDIFKQYLGGKHSQTEA